MGQSSILADYKMSFYKGSVIDKHWKLYEQIISLNMK